MATVAFVIWLLKVPHQVLGLIFLGDIPPQTQLDIEILVLFLMILGLISQLFIRPTIQQRFILMGLKYLIRPNGHQVVL
jgi:hypothetical protein